MRYEKANYESLVHYETIIQKNLIILAYRVLSEGRISNGKEKKKNGRLDVPVIETGTFPRLNAKGKSYH